MLRSEIKEAVLLLVFTGLLHEVLTSATMAFVVATAIAVIQRKRPPKIVRNIMAVGVLLSYWFTYGRFIDPEVGLNFLTTVTAIKLLEKEGVRDRYMVFMGLVLLVSTGALFERTLGYVFFFAVSFMVLISDFYKGIGHRWKARDMGLALLWVLPLTVALYFFIPRLMNPLPFQQAQKRQGEVGYTPDVNLSSLESLSSNDNPVFQALVNKEIPQPLLYWRGNVLSQNDGWNWQVMRQDKEMTLVPELKRPLPSDITQQIRLLTREDFFFMLDRPLKLVSQKGEVNLSAMHTLKQRSWRWVNRYEVISRTGNSPLNEEDHEDYLQVILPRKDKDWIHENFKGRTVSELKDELMSYFGNSGFTYSLSPGRVPNLMSFLQDKKIGLCSHYSSAAALIFRVKGIPSRLVSGFLGGTYNRFSGHYLISQNDAHVWVEVLEDGRWTRLDPTEWVAPERVLLGGEGYMSSVSPGIFGNLASRMKFGLFYDLQQWFGQWDFRFYQWLEEVDYFAQEAWLTRLNIKRKWFYSIAPALLGIFIGLYAWQLSRKRRREIASEEEFYWKVFLSKLQKRGLNIPLNSVADAREHLKHLEHKDQAQIQEAFNALVDFSFGAGSRRMFLKESLNRL